MEEVLAEAARWTGYRKSLNTLKPGAASPATIASQRQTGTKPKKPKAKKGQGQGQAQPGGKSCGNCSSTVEHPKGVECPARTVICKICGKMGHYARTRNGTMLCRSPEAQDMARQEQLARLDASQPPPTYADAAQGQGAVAQGGAQAQGAEPEVEIY